MTRKNKDQRGCWLYLATWSWRHRLCRRWNACFGPHEHSTARVDCRTPPLGTTLGTAPAMNQLTSRNHRSWHCHPRCHLQKVIESHFGSFLCPEYYSRICSQYSFGRLIVSKKVDISKNDQGQLKLKLLPPYCCCCWYSANGSYCKLASMFTRRSFSIFRDIFEKRYSLRMYSKVM